MKNKIKKIISRILFSIVGLLTLFSTVSALDLVVDKSGADGTVRIILAPFPDSQFSERMQTILGDDLRRSGRFTFIDPNKIPKLTGFDGELDKESLKQSNAEYLIRGKSELRGHIETLHVEVIDINNGRRVAGFATHDIYNERRIAHRTADSIYQKLIGIRGVFSTKIAYVAASGGGDSRIYQLIVADADGYNDDAVVTSFEPIMSISWSPRGDSIAFVSFESGNSAIYIQNLKTGKRHTVSARKGINGSPSWSPNGRQLAVSLSVAGNSEIYTIDIASGKIHRVTNARSIDTEPNWTKDSRSVIFTSDRGGSPQLYQVNVTGQPTVKRLTFDGRYNSDADVSGNKVALVRQMNGRFRIVLMDLSSRNSDIISHGSLDESPSLAPNGAMVVYETKGKTQRHVLSVASDNGRANTVIYSPYRDVRHPAWSPYIH